MSTISPAEEWIELLLKRSDDLRRKGILSIGCDGHSAVLAPFEPGDNSGADTAHASGFKETDEDESPNAWENGSSYPSGHVPKLEVDKGELPEIPSFGEDR